MGTEKDYIERLFRAMDVAEKDRLLFEKIARSPSAKRDDVIGGLRTLTERVGFHFALLALYRQQVNAGFVLTDPLEASNTEEKTFFDADTGIPFRMVWNPGRELRRNHRLLIERGIIASTVDESRLVNRDKNGKPCYLCPANIEIQNPAEVLIDIRLEGERFYAGANFAFITNNHFTLMHAEHRPQGYRREIPRIMNAFIERTAGIFRIISNGLAGASIKQHEHLQFTTEPFPIEKIRIRPEDRVTEGGGIRIACPPYALPVWVVEGEGRKAVESAIHEILERWHDLNELHTENLIAVRTGQRFRMFIILRDASKLAGPGKIGVMAAFETGGIVVMSYHPPRARESEVDERATFDGADLNALKRMLKDIAPDEKMCGRLFDSVKRWFR